MRPFYPYLHDSAGVVRQEPMGAAYAGARGASSLNRLDDRHGYQAYPYMADKPLNIPTPQPFRRIPAAMSPGGRVAMGRSPITKSQGRMP